MSGICAALGPLALQHGTFPTKLYEMVGVAAEQGVCTWTSNGFIILDMHSAGAAMAPLGAFSLGYGPVLAYAPALHAHPPFMAMMPPTYPLAPMGFGGGVIMGSAMGAPPPIIAETDRDAAATLAAHTAAFATAPLPHALPRSAGAKRPRDEGSAESHAHSRPKSSGSIIDAAHDRARSSRPETPDAG